MKILTPISYDVLMSKKFISWIINKIIINKTKRNNLIINECQVYWCFWGENIGYEQDGKGENFHRPVLIFKKFNNEMFWGIPLSTKNKDNKYYIKLLLQDIEQSAIISQIRALDTKRLSKYIGYISMNDFIKIQNRIIDIIRR